MQCHRVMLCEGEDSFCILILPEIGVEGKGDEATCLLQHRVSC